MNPLSVISQYSITLSMASGELLFSFCDTVSHGFYWYLMNCSSAGAYEVAKLSSLGRALISLDSKDSSLVIRDLSFAFQ